MQTEKIFFLFLMFCLLSLDGCASQDSRPVAVIEPVAFAHMSKRMGDELIARNILDSSRYYTSASVPDIPYGDILFTRLAPDFLFNDRGAELTSSSFAGAVMPGTRVAKNKNGFRMRSFRQHIQVAMIAVTDWEGNGTPDWLVSCTLDPGNGGRTREYYVVVPAPQGQERLRGRVIAVNECFGLACHFYLNEEERCLPKAPAPKTATDAEDMLPGLSTITTPPDSSPRDEGIIERDLR